MCLQRRHFRLSPPRRHAGTETQPTEAADQKIKKSDDYLNIILSKTTDILKTAKGNFVRVGFAAESQNLVANAKAKVDSKKLDLIVANDITSEGSGFGSDTNQVTLIDRDLVEADLTEANLTGADLTEANLTEADLTGANLTKVNLKDAILTGVIGADFTGALNVPDP